MNQFLLYLIVIASCLFVVVFISTVLFCKRVDNTWRRLKEEKEIEIIEKKIIKH